MTNIPLKRCWLILLSCFFSLLLPVSIFSPVMPALAQSPTTPQVNAPYFGSDDIQFQEMDIFWLGQVNDQSNYADVRIGYNNDHLKVDVAIFDHWLWYDESATPADLMNWDAVSLYLDTQNSGANLPAATSFHFVGQLNHWQARDDYQTAFQGNGSDWVSSTIPFTTTSGWRGDGLNDTTKEARGWRMVFTIPFSSLGLASPPTSGTDWGMALVVHDKDAPSTIVSPDQTWPETISVNQPGSWGRLSFGLPTYNAPSMPATEIITIRQGLNGTSVPDAGVGGHTACGQAYNPDFFDGWGDANYNGDPNTNIQNQSDIADWPCFSKYYVTFPLDQLPNYKSVVSATLTMHLFGGSDPRQATNSYIQTARMLNSWDETTITWNNAPGFLQNYTYTWVEPSVFPGWPRIAYTWDVSQAVAEAQVEGVPLNLALYDADADYHSGKYFVTSDTGDWNEVARPTLRIAVADGFALTSSPHIQLIQAGQAATYTLNIQSAATFTDTLTLSVSDSSDDLAMSLSPLTITASEQATLVVTHTVSTSTVSQ